MHGQIGAATAAVLEWRFLVAGGSLLLGRGVVVSGAVVAGGGVVVAAVCGVQAVLLVAVEGCSGVSQPICELSHQEVHGEVAVQD